MRKLRFGCKIYAHVQIVVVLSVCVCITFGSFALLI